MLILFAAFPLSGAAQDNPALLPAKVFELRAETMAPSEIKFPFSAVKILDNRFDTGKIGYEPVFRNGHNPPKRGLRLVIKGGLAASLENYYNEFYQNAFTNNGTQLLVVIKKLWYSGVNNEKMMRWILPNPIKNADTCIVNGNIILLRTNSIIHLNEQILLFMCSLTR